MSQTEAPRQAAHVVQQAVQHYFSYRADISRMEFRRLMREGRISLIVGVVFLIACLVLAEVISRYGPKPVAEISREGLTIAG